MIIEEEAAVIICSIILEAGAEIEGRHHTITKSIQGGGVEAEREGGAENQATQEDAEVINTIYRQGVTKIIMTIPIYHLIIHNMRGGEAGVDPCTQDTITADITTTEMKGIMTKEGESMHFTNLIIIAVKCTVLNTLGINKKKGIDLHLILRDMVRNVFH